MRFSTPAPLNQLCPAVYTPNLSCRAEEHVSVAAQPTMSPGGAPSTALVITASVTAALVTAALGEALRRLCAVPPPREDPRPSTEELIALVLAVQAKADRAERAERAAPAAKRALDLGNDVAGSRETSPRGLRSDSARDSRDSQDSPHSRFRNANAHSPGQVRKLSASSGASSLQRDESRGMQRSSSVGSQLHEHVRHRLGLQPLDQLQELPQTGAPTP